MNLWAIFRSPMMFGGDLPSNDAFTLSLLTNDELLEVTNNSENNRELKNDKGLIVWTADIPQSKDKYVAFFNTNDDNAAEISVSIAELGITGNWSAKDLWSKKSEKLKEVKLVRNIAPHASAIFRLSK
jgi:hypothetical protein